MTLVFPMVSSKPAASWMWPWRRRSGLNLFAASVMASEPSTPEHSDVEFEGCMWVIMIFLSIAACSRSLWAFSSVVRRSCSDVLFGPGPSAPPAPKTPMLSWMRE